MGRKIERLKVATDGVGHLQRLARDAPVRRERTLERGGRQSTASSGQQLSPVHIGALVRQVRDDDVVGDVDSGLLTGVALQRLAQRVVQSA